MGNNGYSGMSMEELNERYLQAKQIMDDIGKEYSRRENEQRERYADELLKLISKIVENGDTLYIATPLCEEGVEIHAMEVNTHEIIVDIY